jgi:hypothetical protein
VRRAELPGVVTALDAPITEFVRDARLRLALLVRGSGQVLAQHGFTGGYELMNVASLAAAAHASSRALAHVVGSAGWSHLYHAGRQRSLFLAPLATPAEELIVIAIFDDESSIGLVQFYFDRLAGRVARLGAFQQRGAGTTQHEFERDLHAGLQRLFSADNEAEE